ncbi:MAG TPA: ROK family protein [Vicinamibacteria bacterium]|nr:ROK family protein [Vicinamibacteria bacterium]
MRIGVDLGGTKIEAIALGPGGVEQGRRRIATPRDDYPATVEAVARVVEDLESTLGAQATVGVGMPGAISPATGLVKNANSVWLIGQPLDRDLSTRLRRPVRLANDANCFALSEATDGAGRGARVVFGVIVGTGTGGGIAVDGRVLVGPNAVAGEWGHNPLPWPREGEWPGPACYCGKTACIETFLSGPALVLDHERTTGERVPAPELPHRAAGGDAAAEATLARYEDRMARALAAVINILDPDVIVLGGGMSNMVRLYESVPRLWTKYAFSDRVDTPLRAAVHGDSSGVRGAAWLWPEAEFP